MPNWDRKIPSNELKSLFFWLVLLLLLFAIPSYSAPIANPEPACRFAGVTFTGDFPGGRISACEQTGKKRFKLDILPENEPINKSPWYAFKVQSASAQTVTVVIDYRGYQHRYRPKISHDGVKWTPLADKFHAVLSKGKRLRLKLAVDNRPLWVAGQEVLTNQQHALWGNYIAQLPYVEKRVLGKSVEGRELFKLESSSATVGNPGYVVIVGRQHPPELTGALSLMPFVQTVFADTDLAGEFRAKFNLLIVPNLNPDGVEHGHWRHNANGKDLNRDWKKFRQPETRLVQNELKRFMEEGAPPLYLFLDFHSTNQNAFYTQPDHQPTFPRIFAKKWLAAIAERIPQMKVNRGGSDNYNLSTSKAYMYRTFGIPAITYEMGDETDRRALPVIAQVAAEEMMKILVAEYRENPVHPIPE